MATTCFRGVRILDECFTLGVPCVRCATLNGQPNPRCVSVNITSRQMFLITRCHERVGLLEFVGGRDLDVIEVAVVIRPPTLAPFFHDVEYFLELKSSQSIDVESPLIESCSSAALPHEQELSGLFPSE